MTLVDVIGGSPYAENQRMCIGEGGGVSVATPRLWPLLCKKTIMAVAMTALWSGYADKFASDGEGNAGDSDMCVFSVCGKPYRMSTLLSDAEIMLRNRLKSAEDNPGERGMSAYILAREREEIKTKGFNDETVLEKYVKPMAKAAADVFVKKNLLLDGASKLGIAIDDRGAGPENSLFNGTNGYVKALFASTGIRFVDRDPSLFQGTSVAITKSESLAISELVRREMMPKVRNTDDRWRTSSEEACMWRYIAKRKAGNIVPFDYQGSLEAVFARKLARKTANGDGKKAAVPLPKVNSRLVVIPRGINRGPHYCNSMKQNVEMDATEVSLRDWNAIKDWAEANGYEFICQGAAKGEDYPVAEVCWYDCLRWCNARSEAEGLAPVYLVDGEPFRKGAGTIPQADVSKTGYRLPTMEEWKYAARGGKKGLLFPWGNTISHDNANYRGTSMQYDLSKGYHPKFAGEHTWRGDAAPVGSFKPNGFGLYDMAGNVWEFTQDTQGEYVRLRGGGFNDFGMYARIELDACLDSCHLSTLCEGRPDVGFRTMRLSAKSMDEISRAIVPKATEIDDSQWRCGFSGDWFVNWDKALAEARKTGKALFILRDGSDWCPYSKRQKAEVFDNPEFAEFARKNLVLLLLDSPKAMPLGNEQKEHNQLIVKTLSLGFVIPLARVMTAKGETLGDIRGGGIGLDQYLDRLRRILGNKGEPMVDENARRLFVDGYAAFAAHVAAIKASLPPFNKKDFTAKVTGVALMTSPKQSGKMSDLKFLPPETPLEVPLGTEVAFRVEYDFPTGYLGDVDVYSKSCDDGESHSNYFYNKGSGKKKGRGTAYTFMRLLDRGRTCNLKTVSLSLGAESEFEGGTHIWTADKIPVNLMFKNPANTDDEYSSIPSDTKVIFRDSSFDKNSFVPPAVSTCVPKGWTEDFEAAKRRAARENKLVLVAFTGSDWCKWTKKMIEEVFSKEAFVEEAAKKYVLVMIDIPDDDIILSKFAQKNNTRLSKRYSVRCYPTMVIFNSDGTEVKRHSGYRKGGPQGYIDYLNGLP